LRSCLIYPSTLIGPFMVLAETRTYYQKQLLSFTAGLVLFPSLTWTSQSNRLHWTGSHFQIELTINLPPWRVITYPDGETWIQLNFYQSPLLYYMSFYLPFWVLTIFRALTYPYLLNSIGNCCCTTTNHRYNCISGYPQLLQPSSVIRSPWQNLWASVVFLCSILLTTTSLTHVIILMYCFDIIFIHQLW